MTGAALSLLIKPASGRCNLRCKYCFYEDEMDHRTEQDCGLMSEDTLELLIRQAMEVAEKRVSFAFQGGEPVLRGLPFFQKFIELERKYARSGMQIEHSIQTNGTLINEEWAAFFEEHNFLVGLSVDGIKELHDRNRVDASGKGSWNAVENARKILAKRGVNTNVVCVVTASVARRGQAVYTNLKKLGFRYVQFIPCLDPMEKERGNEPYSLSPERYGQFLCTIFDLWYKDWEQGNYVSVRMFDDLVHILAGQPAGTCTTNGSCGRYLVVEGDGSVYPCDFFAVDQWKLGDLKKDGLSALLESRLGKQFCVHGCGQPEECSGCPWVRLCNGGCQRDWVGNERNYYCAALRKFFQYTYHRLRHIAELERHLNSL